MSLQNIIWIIKVILFALLLLSSQLMLTRYVYLAFGFPDILLCYFIMLIFHSKGEQMRSLFVIAFLLGIVQSVWFNVPFRIGTTSFFYLIITYNITFYSLFMHGSVQMLFVALGLFVVKFLSYSVLGIIFRMDEVFDFLLSRDFIFQIIATFIILLFICVPINIVKDRRKEF